MLPAPKNSALEVSGSGRKEDHSQAAKKAASCSASHAHRRRLACQGRYEPHDPFSLPNRDLESGELRSEQEGKHVSRYEASHCGRQGRRNAYEWRIREWCRAIEFVWMVRISLCYQSYVSANSRETRQGT